MGGFAMAKAVRPVRTYKETYIMMRDIARHCSTVRDDTKCESVWFIERN
jgi:hypothetical protein